MSIKKFLVTILVLFTSFTYACASLPTTKNSSDSTFTYELLKNADFETWSSNKVKESLILGGNSVELMNLGKPWGTSNVWAKICGVVKTNVSVYRDTHPNHGHCVKLYTHIVSAKVLGVINIKVLAAGSLYLGDIVQPIRDTKEPMAKQNTGMPFTKSPKAIMFDYKMRVVKGDRIHQNGISKGSTVKGQDMGCFTLFLQKRWEDADGNIYAKRIGTSVALFDKNTNWIENAKFDIHYGDITKKSFYNSYWALRQGEETKYARNSKGKMVPVKEVGWGTPGEKPTHLVLQFDSSHGGAYVGSVGNTLWIDNIRMVY